MTPLAADTSRRHLEAQAVQRMGPLEAFVETGDGEGVQRFLRWNNANPNANQARPRTMPWTAAPTTNAGSEPQ